MNRVQTLALGRLAGLIAVALAAAPAAAAKPDGGHAFDGVRRVFLDPALHDLDRRDAADVVHVAEALDLGAFLPADPATTLTVGNCNDGGEGSLRAAVASAASGDTIDLRAVPCATIALTSGPIAIAQDALTLLGPGAGALELTAGGGKYDNRVLEHAGSGLLLIEGVTVSGGTVAGTSDQPSVAGGCIRSSGTLSLGNPLFVAVPAYGAAVENCRAIANADGQGLAAGGGVYADELLMTNSRISGCELEAYSDGTGLHVDGGGGAMASSRVALFQSVLSGNSETGSKYGGGGLAVAADEGSDLIIASTIADNSARVGGGLTIGSDVTVRNSTVSGNRAGNAAGIAIAGIAAVATIENSTITGNVATGDGGGAGVYFAGAGGSTITSTIVWGNFRSMSVPDDVGGNAAPSGSANLVGIPSLAMPGDTIIGVDPHLGPLADNGGPTQTHALRADSQAIGRGSNPAGEDYDQRGPGHPRVVGGHADIGAYEYSDAIFADGFD